MTSITPNRQWLFLGMALTIMLGFLGSALYAAELVARSMEPKAVSGMSNTPHPIVGWLPSPGKYRVISKEFETTASINTLNMNDREVSQSDTNASERILALGDSHTFAVGASTDQTWPKLIETKLFKNDPTGVVLNAGVIGYSLGQYLQRYRLLADAVRPTTVLLGFSMATDLYDLIPPERGGFIYGGDAAREFFDLDGSGKLIERIHTGTTRQVPSRPRDSSQALRTYLEGYALYRLLKRSKVAMTVAMYYRPGGKSLWPGLDTAMKVKLDEEDIFRWKLAERILERLVIEARANGTKVGIVIIPYLAQVYDEVWSSSFGRRPELYERDIASKRLVEICTRIGAECIDTTKAFIEAARERKRWLHWPEDAHPTPEGHELISEVVVRHIGARAVLPRPQ